MRPHLAVAGSLLLSAIAGASSEALPSRPSSACLDQADVLSFINRSQIDRMAERGKAGGELVVVVIDTVGGVNPRKYATRLFNKWALDEKGRNRGVLFLAAIQDRKAEIVVGDGFGGSATQITNDVMSRIVVPHFKAGEPRAAMLEGSRALVDRLLLSAEAVGVERAASSGPGFVEQGEEVLGQLGWGLWILTLAATGVLGFFLRRWLRHRARQCPGCDDKMFKLSEANEDDFLSRAEQVEETLGSVDYDVWFCRTCHQTIKLRYGKVFSEFKECPSCGHKTMKTTIRLMSAATEYDEGRERVDQKCQSCRHRGAQVRLIPRVQQRRTGYSNCDDAHGSNNNWSNNDSWSNSSSSSSCDSSSSSSSSFSSSDSSSSSGGSSSGHGSSGSW